MAWREGIGRLIGLPYNTHCEHLNLICDDLPIDNQIINSLHHAKRVIMF